MTKQTVYLNDFARKSGFRAQFLVCLLNSPLLERSDGLSNKCEKSTVAVLNAPMTY